MMVSVVHRAVKDDDTDCVGSVLDLRGNIAPSRVLEEGHYCTFFIIKSTYNMYNGYS